MVQLSLGMVFYQWQQATLPRMKKLIDYIGISFMIGTIALQTIIHIIDLLKL